MRYPAQAWSPGLISCNSEVWEWGPHLFFFPSLAKRKPIQPLFQQELHWLPAFSLALPPSRKYKGIAQKSHRWQNVLCRQWLTQTGQGMLLVIKLSSPFAAALNTYYGCQAVSKLSDDPTSSGCKVTWQLQGCLVHGLVGLGKLVPAAEPQEYVSTKGWLLWKIPHAWKSVSVSRMCRWRNRVN